MRSDIGSDSRLVEGVHVCAGSIKHAIKLKDITVGFSTTKLVAGSLR